MRHGQNTARNCIILVTDAAAFAAAVELAILKITTHPLVLNG